MSKDVTPSPRKWWIASILYVLSGSVAYIYLGKHKRFAIFLFFSLFLFIALIHGLWGLLSTPIFYLSFTACVIIGYIAFFIDVIRLSVIQRGYILRPYNHILIYVAGMLIIGGISFQLSNPDIRSVRIYRIPSEAMQPTLEPGDIVLADMHSYKSRPPILGDVIVLTSPKHPKFEMIKRVIGLPSDTVILHTDRIFINDLTVHRQSIDSLSSPTGLNSPRYNMFKEELPNGRTYRIYGGTENISREEKRTYTVPELNYFVLGDNRGKSLDSRHAYNFGYLPAKNINGKVTGIIFSKTLSKIGNRFESQEFIEEYAEPAENF